MNQSDKEFLCYLICLSWDRLDDQERIRASKIIREITDKEEDVPKVEYVTPEIISRRVKVVTEVPADDISAREEDEPERRGGPPDKVFYYNEGYCL